MLFLGTERYPEEGSFSKFLSANGECPPTEGGGREAGCADPARGRTEARRRRA